MTRSRLLAGAAALALLVAAPSASFAAGPGARGGGGANFGGGAAMGGGAHFSGGAAVGGGGGARFGGGGGARFTAAPGGGTFTGAPATRFAAAPSGGTFAGRPGWNGGFWRGGHFHHHRGFFPGFVAGAVVGGALADSYAYYDDPYYYGPDYYYDTGPEVAVVQGGGDASYCAQRYRSWDPATGTYLGYDGLRHPCP